MTHPPKTLQAILWSVDVDTLNIEKDKPYIIHQILSHGTLAHIQWLFQTYTRDAVKTVFQTSPYKDYRAARFHFITDHIFHMGKNTMDSRRYVKNTPRAIG